MKKLNTDQNRHRLEVRPVGSVMIGVKPHLVVSGYAADSVVSSCWSPFTVTFRWLVTSRCSLIGT
jgi:hypothetical protein